MNTSYWKFREFLENEAPYFLNAFEALCNIHPLDNTEPCKDGLDFCLNRVEAELIEYYDSVNCGYNRAKGDTRATRCDGIKLAIKNGNVN